MSIDARSVTPLIQVFDMGTSFAFYRDQLGCEIVATGGPEDDIGWAMLRLGEAYFMLNTVYELADRPASRDPAHTAAHRDTTLYFICPNVDEVFTSLVERGVRAKPPKDAPYGMRQVYVVDPDGYSLCFQCEVEHKRNE